MTAAEQPIVKQLRHEARFMEAARSVNDEATVEYGRMCNRAADEIERLREVNDDLRDALEGADAFLDACSKQFALCDNTQAMQRAVKAAILKAQH